MVLVTCSRDLRTRTGWEKSTHSLLFAPGSSWVARGLQGVVWGLSWGVLGRFWAGLGLGTLEGVLGRSWAGLGLGMLEDGLGSSCGRSL